MTRDEVVAAIAGSERKRVRIRFADDVVQWVDIASVDDEGILHSGPDGAEPSGYWTRFTSVTEIQVPQDSRADGDA